jgi:hypothetical protein
MSCRLPWASHQLETTASMSRGALSQWKNHYWDIISGLFSRKFYTPWASGRDLVSIRRSSAMAVATEEMIFVLQTVFLRLRWHAHCLLNNSVSLQRTQAPVPMGSFHCFFYFCKAFAGSGEISDEVLHPRHTWAGGGGSARLAPSRSSGAQLNFR